MIVMASDHRGFLLKEALKNFFNQENIITIDVGSYSKEPVDYPDFARLGMDKVLEQPNNVGIFICGSGIGMSMAANRNPNIRAALCLNTKMAALARKDNDANVLCLPGNLRKKKAIAIVKVFLTTNFEGGRHARRLKKVSELAALYAKGKISADKKAIKPQKTEVETKLDKNSEKRNVGKQKIAKQTEKLKTQNQEFENQNSGNDKFGNDKFGNDKFEKQTENKSANITIPEKIKGGNKK